MTVPLHSITNDFIEVSSTNTFEVTDEIRSIVDELSRSLASLSTQLQKPNILLIGKTGAGKSSLVNAVFGRKFAETGSGAPVTKHLEKYAPEDKPVVLPNCLGIFEVVSDRKNYSAQFCPQCHSEAIRFKPKTKEIFCENTAGGCGATSTLGPTGGLGALVEATMQQLPALARDYFIAAQEVSEMARLRLASDIVRDTAARVSLAKGIRDTTGQLVAMATRLLLLWNLTLLPSLVMQEVAYQFWTRIHRKKSVLGMVVLSLRDWLASHCIAEALAVAIGVELCRLLCELRLKVVNHALRPHSLNHSADQSAGGDCTADCAALLGCELPGTADSTFQLDVSQKFLEEVTRGIRTRGLDAALDDLMARKCRALMERPHGVRVGRVP